MKLTLEQRRFLDGEGMDITQCEALKPNGTNAFTLGGDIGGMDRCNNKPTVICTEKNVTRGRENPISTALCDDCLEVAKTQLGADTFTVTRLITI